MTISEYIAEAIKSGKTVKIKYVKNSGEISERTISDIGPSDEFGEGYISAFCHLRNETRTFKISRIREVDGIKAFSSTVPKTKSGYTPKPSYTPRISPSTVSSSSSSMDSRPSSPSPSYKPSYNHSHNNTPSSSNSQKSEGCYIATMAYGDYDHPSVIVQFRDEKLLTNYIGRVFVSFYYWVSPKMVKVLTGHRRTNTIIRAVLDKIVLHMNSK
mgnify:CR=1 FL=1